MSDESQREQLAEEHRNHRRKLDSLRAEYAPSRAINDEYRAHQSRIGVILNDGNQPCIGTAGGPTA